MSEIHIRTMCEACKGTGTLTSHEHTSWMIHWKESLSTTGGDIGLAMDKMNEMGHTVNPPAEGKRICPACKEGYIYHWMGVETLSVTKGAISSGLPLRQRRRSFYTTNYLEQSKPPTNLGQALRNYGLKHKMENSVALGSRLGVSGTTITRILHGKHLIGRTTVKKVLESIMPQAGALTEKYFENHNQYAMTMVKEQPKGD